MTENSRLIATLQRDDRGTDTDLTEQRNVFILFGQASKLLGQTDPEHEGTVLLQNVGIYQSKRRYHFNAAIGMSAVPIQVKIFYVHVTVHRNKFLNYKTK
jgi:hypothetical protein